MAYMDFRGAEHALAIAPAAHRPLHRPPVADRGDRAGGFARIEWTVIALARHERVADIAPPGWAGRLIAALFGAKPVLPLADARLEALRRVAVLSWQCRPLPAAVLAAFEQHGFTAAQLALLLSRIAGFVGAAA